MKLKNNITNSTKIPIGKMCLLAESPMVHYKILSSLLSHFIFQHEIITCQHDLNMQINFFLNKKFSSYKMHSSALFFILVNFSLHGSIGTETFTYISSYDNEGRRYFADHLADFRMHRK